MTEIIIPILTAVAGFIAGALVYRKHTKEAERVIKQMQDANAQLKKRLDSRK
ncbi:hypothetical protein [Morganella morganii]|uniref:hypothetical protein n=1 Tax=Morganella morganii TaxID=582 RepID=UPI0014198918|nr:hypothetical protein [Morganella morganii]NIH18400.1 hypothetical protein [Morganella morganii]